MYVQQYQIYTNRAENSLQNTLSNLSLDPEGRRGTTEDLVTSCLHLCLSSTTLCDSGKYSPVHLLTLSSNHFLCLPLLLATLTVPCRQDGLYQAR